MLLRGVGAATVLGHIELADVGTLRLGNVAGEHFGLYLLGGETPDCAAVYTLAQLVWGDLGQLLRWSHQTQRVPAWHNATVLQDRDPPWISARGSRLRSRVPVAESASQFKGTKRSRDPP